jgi:hypothetical protein
MKFVWKASLGLLALGGLVAIHYGDNFYQEKQENKKKQASVALFFETKDVLKFSVQNKNGLFTFTRASVDAPWELLTPTALSADQDTANQILSTLSQVSIQQEIAHTAPAAQGAPSTSKSSPHEASFLEQFGLNKAPLQARVFLKDHKELTLLVGSSLNSVMTSHSDLGKQSLNAADRVPPLAHVNSRYAFLPTSQRLLVIQDTVQTALENKTLADFRTKRITQFQGAQVSRIELVQKELKPVQVLKNKDQWEVQKPFPWPADTHFISNFLMRYQGLLAEQVYERAELTPLLKKKLKLADPVAHVTFKDAAGKILQKLNFSLTKDGVYTTMADGAVAKVALSLWTDLVPQDKLFRNRRVLLGVQMEDIARLVLSPSLGFVKKDNQWFRVSSRAQQPAVSETPNPDALSFFSNFEFMTADDVILNPAQKDLEKFGFAKPLKEFSFEFHENSKQKALTMSVGNRVPNNEKLVYLKRSDSSSVYLVDTGDDWLSVLAQLYSLGDSSQSSVTK